MDFKNIPNKYRPIPFWSWNEKLEPVETKDQVRKMRIAGMGGFFMHARGGLQTPYMGEEWFENVTAALEEAEKQGMYAWAYDENGWPSGFGDGLVNGLGIEYQQKYLRVSEIEPKEHIICKNGNHWFYYDVNPFYVDTLDKKVVRKFIEVAYQPYYERYGHRIEGFFTDEPQISRNGIPWSFVYEEEYQKRYGKNILEHLEELFFPVNDYKKTRVNFWKMVTDLFSEAYMKQIYDQCNEWGLKLTGHLVLEESLESQLVSNGACMPHYEYFHIPGMDWLGRGIMDCLTMMQLSSAAEQLGKDDVLSETFALCGHNVSFAELKGIYEWQMVRGITLLCTHLAGYSIRGIRKRDYPPALFYQQPWWEDYEKFLTAMSRVGMILSKGQRKVDVLVLHPQTTAWTLYDDKKNEGLRELNDQLLKVMKELEQKHISYHLGDETMLERHGKVQNGKLVVGKQSYSYVVDPGCEVLFENTKRLLKEFEMSGGQLVTAQELPENLVVDRADITYTKRIYDDFVVHYFVNSSGKRKSAKIFVNGQKMDIYSGELETFWGVHEFEPWGSLLLIDREAVQRISNMEVSTEVHCEVIKNTSDMAYSVGEKDSSTNENDNDKKQNDKNGRNVNGIIEETVLYVDGKYQITDPFENCMTLDKCDYYFDDELQEKNGYVLNICERANRLERAVQIHQDYHVKIDVIPENLSLVCETPEIFEITINGQRIAQKVNGCFVDKTFKKIDIASYVQQGDNVISFDCNFEQSKEFYEKLKKACVFESEKNKLSYDMEIEAIYLVGSFGVKTEGEWVELNRDANRYVGEFVLDKPPTTIELQHMEKQGLPFFCGKLLVEGELDIQGENPVLKLRRKGWNVVKIEINGIEKTMLSEDKIYLNEFGATGVTKVKFTLINNLRNLLGPHHLKEGESYGVGPHSFFKEPCVWNGNPSGQWDEDYCFVTMGI